MKAISSNEQWLTISYLTFLGANAQHPCMYWTQLDAYSRLCMHVDTRTHHAETLIIVFHLWHACRGL